MSFRYGDESNIIFEKFESYDIVYERTGKFMLSKSDKDMNNFGWGVDISFKQDIGGLLSSTWYFYLKAFRSVVSLPGLSILSCFSVREKHDDEVLLKKSLAVDNLVE